MQAELVRSSERETSQLILMETMSAIFQTYQAFRDLIPVKAMQEAEDLRPGRKRHARAEDGYAALGGVH